jgi:hypothetical protein
VETLGSAALMLTVTTKHGRKLTYSRSRRSRAFYRSPMPTPCVSVAAPALASAPLNCGCGIRDSHGWRYCVGAYGGCERFESRFKGLHYA